MKKKNLTLIVAIISIVAVSITMRLLPHPANFIPMGALALFVGTYMRSKWGILIPLGIMILTDAIIGWHNLVFFTWGSYLLIGMIGWWIRERKHVGRILGGALGGSLVFFIVTNTAVWAFTPLYSKTLAGLSACFTLALPFFRNTAFGDLFYVGVFFGTYEAARYAYKVYGSKRAAYSVRQQ